MSEGEDLVEAWQRAWRCLSVAIDYHSNVHRQSNGERVGSAIWDSCLVRFSVERRMRGER